LREFYFSANLQFFKDAESAD